MKKIIAVCIVSASIITQLSQAAEVVWQAPKDIVSSDDVVTDGDQVFGRNIAIATGFEVNGVKFGYLETYELTFKESAISARIFNSEVPELAGANAAYYQTILGASRDLTNPGTFTLGNLTEGKKYLIQFFVADFRGFPNDRTLTLGTPDPDDSSDNAPTLKFLDSDLSNGADASHGQFVIGTFTADSATITFSMTGNDTATYTAMQVRVIPEP